MKILVINCSPKGERSDCMKLTRALLEGMEETAEVVNAAELNVKPCLGCYSCWRATPGECIHRDDMAALLPKIVSSELVIWSTPLYCYGFPASGKAIIDRMLPLTCPQQEVAEDGSTYHPNRQQSDVRFMLVSGCGFPNLQHNYEAMLMQFGMMFGGDDFPRITCAESPLLSIPEAAPVVEPYLALVRRAGAELKRDGAISAQTQRLLDTPMLDPVQYRANVSGQ